MQIRFDRLPGGPDNEARFIEAENDKGESVKLEWRRDGGDALLIIPDMSAECREAQTELRLLRAAIRKHRERLKDGEQPTKYDGVLWTMVEGD